MKTKTGWLILSATLLLGRAASAQGPEPAFGEAGHFAVSVERMFGYAHTSIDQSTGGLSVNTSVDTISLLGNVGTSNNAYSYPRLAGDFFVAPNISVGAAVGFVHISESPGNMNLSGTGFLLAPRAGYAVRINPFVTLWPRAGLTYVRGSSVTIAQADNVTISVFALTLEMPIAFRVGPHLYLLAGPSVDIGLAGSTDFGGGGGNLDTKATDIGLQVGLAGYL
jgi:hypothetical protein